MPTFMRKKRIVLVHAMQTGVPYFSQFWNFYQRTCIIDMSDKEGRNTKNSSNSKIMDATLLRLEELFKKWIRNWTITS
jgi:hypothetical protein